MAPPNEDDINMDSTPRTRRSAREAPRPAGNEDSSSDLPEFHRNLFDLDARNIIRDLSDSPPTAPAPSSNRPTPDVSENIVPAPRESPPAPSEPSSNTDHATPDLSANSKTPDKRENHAAPLAPSANTDLTSGKNIITAPGDNPSAIPEPSFHENTSSTFLTKTAIAKPEDSPKDLPKTAIQASFFSVVLTDYTIPAPRDSAPVIPEPSFQTNSTSLISAMKTIPEPRLTSPSTSTATHPPPVLSPSVEEAYRRKCIQLKTRLNEVQSANDVKRVKLLRMNRGIDKLRLERVVLLEALNKRTSTNVEDSEGSPSPPPTPKEKPLRIKRGHRKPTFLANTDGLPGGSFIQQASTLSPSGSDAISHADHPFAPSQLPAPQRLLQPSNGLSAAQSATPPPSKLKSAFEVFGNEFREQTYREGVPEPERVLAQRWQAMDDAQRGEYQRQYDGLKNQGNGTGEDVEMGDVDDEAGAPSSFSAVDHE